MCTSSALGTSSFSSGFLSNGDGMVNVTCSCIFFAHMESRITVPKKNTTLLTAHLLSLILYPRTSWHTQLAPQKIRLRSQKNPSDRRGRIATTSYSLLPLAGSMSWGWAKRPWALVPWASRGPPAVCLHLKKSVRCSRTLVKSPRFQRQALAESL